MELSSDYIPTVAELFPLQLHNVSDRSAREWQHEQFHTFQHRVIQFGREFFSLSSTHEITVEKMRGGAFNRIIAMRIKRNQGDGKAGVRNYILRMPRRGYMFSEEHAPLHLLKDHRRRSFIPVPTIVTHNDSKENVLGVPYTLQKRLPGRDLACTEPAFDGLPHSMQCAIARDLGRAYAQMDKIRSTTAGHLHVKLIDGARSFYIQPFCERLDDTMTPYKDGNSTEDAGDMILQAFEARMQLNRETIPDPIPENRHYSALIGLVKQLKRYGVFKSKYNCLCHLDLEARNVLAVEPSSEGTRAVSGILDWDSAVFAPPYMCCKPPAWLWRWTEDGEDEHDEKKANDTPSTPEGCEIKAIFEKEAGPAYMRHAYDTKYRLARALTGFILERPEHDSRKQFKNDWNEFIRAKKKPVVTGKPQDNDQTVLTTVALSNQGDCALPVCTNSFPNLAISSNQVLQ